MVPATLLLASATAALAVVESTGVVVASHHAYDSPPAATTQPGSRLDTARGEQAPASASQSSTSSIAGGRAPKAGNGRLARLRERLADETGSITLPRSRRAPEFPGGQVTETGALNSAIRYLEGYREVSPGRFVSASGARQVRYGTHEVRSRVHHIHFEALRNGRVIENTRAEIVP